MQNTGEDFTIDYNNNQLKVETFKLAQQVIYRLIFTDGKTPLFITKASTRDQAAFWTSVPEGRQKLAEEIGPLIDQYLILKQKS